MTADLIADILGDVTPGLGDLRLVVISQAAQVVGGHRRIVDDHRPGPGRTHAGHLREDHAELGGGVA
jgi:hypothetical protein